MCIICRLKYLKAGRKKNRKLKTVQLDQHLTGKEKNMVKIWTKSFQYTKVNTYVIWPRKLLALQKAKDIGLQETA